MQNDRVLRYPLNRFPFSVNARTHNATTENAQRVFFAGEWPLNGTEPSELLVLIAVENSQPSASLLD